MLYKKLVLPVVVPIAVPRNPQNVPLADVVTVEQRDGGVVCLGGVHRHCHLQTDGQTERWMYRQTDMEDRQADSWKKARTDVRERERRLNKQTDWRDKY